MKYIVLIALSIFGLQQITAQNYKFGKVSVEELQEKFNPQDSSANATYLYKYRRTYFVYNQNDGFELQTEIHERVKIYNQEGFEYATKEVNLYNGGSNKLEIIGLKAYTYNYVDGKIEEIKLKKDGIFKTELSKYYNQTKFTLPNIKAGSVIEYKYTVKSPFFSNVDEFQFQHDIPVKTLKATFESPEYFNYKVKVKGYLNVTPKTENKNDAIRLKATKEVKEGLKIIQYARSAEDIRFNKSVSSYSLSDIPALKDEPFVNNINNYRSSVKYELSFTKFPNSMINYYSTTWEDVVKTIYKNSSFGKELDKSGYYKDDIDALISGISDPMEKAATIFNFVKTKVKWNNYYSKYTDEGVKKAYKNQVGNSAEINLMLTSMLRYAGLNANPVLVSTRHNGIPLFPTRSGYNYVICGIEVAEDVILLDATNQYSSPNVLPYRTLNWQGRIIRKEGSTALVDLYPKLKTKNSISMNVELNENGDANGMIRNIKTNHSAMGYRESYINKNEEEFLEKLENKYDGIEISDFEVKNETDLSKPIVESYKFLAEEQAEIIGDKIFISPMFFFTTKENPFKLEKREFPVDFGYPRGGRYVINVKTPEGYSIESAPKPISVKLPDNLGGFKYNISTTDTSIQLIVNYDINTSIISSLYYDILKEYYKQIIDKENERIVLTKQ